jgi:hypothetical protein
VRVFLKISVPGAREAAARSDVVAIIDALRASVTLTSALIVGAVKVIPVLTVRKAQAYLDQAGIWSWGSEVEFRYLDDGFVTCVQQSAISRQQLALTSQAVAGS